MRKFAVTSRDHKLSVTAGERKGERERERERERKREQACLSPEHFRSWKSDDVAVECGRFADVGGDVVNLNAKFRL